MGTRAGRHYLPNLLPTWHSERKTRRTIEAFGVPLEKKGVEKQPITMVLGKNHFEERLTRSFICSSARVASLPERRWTEEFLASIREEGKKDEAYEQARKPEAATEDLSPKDPKVKEVSCENNLLYKRTDGTAQPDDRSLPTSVCQQGTARLGTPATDGRVHQ